MFNLDRIAGTDAYTLTAYFVDPRTICESSVNSNRDKETTGTGLWLQNGPDPIRDSFSVPLYESGITETKWVRGHCFPSMGKCITILEKNKTIKIISRCSLLV
jgi:hypothetical protein